MAKNLPACDVFHGISYCGLRSGCTAQRMGVKWVCDAVNSHLVFQDEILAEEYDRVGLEYERQDRRFLDYAEASYEQADLITIPSVFVRGTFLAKGVPEEKLAFVPWGVDLLRFYPTASPQGNVFRVLFVGHLSVRKGLHDVLEAFRIASLPSAELLLVGSPQPETAALLRRAVGVSPRVMGPQPKSKLNGYYSRSDVMVLSSIEDAFGYVIGEAMACGCPVIATENTGGPDFFTDGVEGFIVPIRSPEAIAEKLLWLYRHPELRFEMRAAALKRVKSIGGWDTYGERMLETFQTLIGSSEEGTEKLRSHAS
ncbi:MAG: glycosyltransferase family 4 protein [Deltaproteobacteria bacterium]|nr:glycosyltransferase family 4 protein [Deltaproteobacteria bacterium]